MCVYLHLLPSVAIKIVKEDFYPLLGTCLGHRSTQVNLSPYLPTALLCFGYQGSCQHFFLDHQLFKRMSQV